MGNDDHEKVGTWVRKSDIHIGMSNVPTGTLGRITENENRLIDTLYPYHIEWVEPYFFEPYSAQEFIVIEPTDEDITAWALRIMKK